MIRRYQWTLAILFAGCAMAGDWTQPVEVRHDVNLCISYRAKLSGDVLMIQATPEHGWHTFAMDNKQRAEEKLAGRKALAVDRPTELTVSQGLEVGGPWRQSPPKDFSKPELRIFTWGFDQPALFAARIKRSGAGPARIEIRGQACDEATCKNIDVAISVPITGSGADAGSGIDLKTLVQVR